MSVKVPQNRLENRNLILSTLDYCNSLLIGATNKDILPLQRVLNRAVRLVFDLKKRDHITPYLFKLHFLPVKFRIQYKICLFAYKIVNGLSPDYLVDEFEMFRPTTNIQLRKCQGRDEDVFKLGPLKSTVNSLFSKLALQWNNLPYEVRISESIPKFKSKLKTHFFKIAYANLIN